MTNRRTRDQLRASNDKLRAAIRRFVAVQDQYLDIHHDTGTHVPRDWKEAYDAMKELMGSELDESSRPEKPPTKFEVGDLAVFADGFDRTPVKVTEVVQEWVGGAWREYIVYKNGVGNAGFFRHLSACEFESGLKSGEDNHE